LITGTKQALAATLIISSVWGLAVFAQDKTNSTAPLDAIQLKIRKAVDRGRYAEADALYLQAVDMAKLSGKKKALVEMLSHLARNRVLYLKPEDADPFAKQTIDIIRASKKDDSYDPEMGVWGSDLTDAYYERGEITKDATKKNYLAERYLLLSFLLKDGFDQLVAQRAEVIITALDYDGKYVEATALTNAMLGYLKRTRPWDSQQIANAYLKLGVNLLGAKQTAQAGQAFFYCLDTDKKAGKRDGIHLIYLERYGAVLRMEEGKLAEAESLIKSYLVNHTKFVGSVTECVGEDYYFYAYIFEKEKKTENALKYYRMSLEVFDKLAKKLKTHGDKGTVFSGQALAAEGIERLKGPDAILMSARAKNIRKQFPEWSKRSNLDGPTFFILWDHLPWPMGTIPTRVKII
jgi:tetratricopeptide (TPR) repeat protein